MCGPVDCFVFDGGELAEAALAARVLGPLDPGDDGQAQVLAGRPPLAFQGRFLQMAILDTLLPIEEKIRRLVDDGGDSGDA